MTSKCDSCQAVCEHQRLATVKVAVSTSGAERWMVCPECRARMTDQAVRRRLHLMPVLTEAQMPSQPYQYLDQ